MKIKGGRPLLEKNNSLTRKVTIRFKENDYNNILDFFGVKKEDKKKHIGSKIRDMLLKNINNKEIVIQKIQPIEYLNELNKIGVNINQLVKKHNSIKTLNQNDVTKMNDLLDKISNIILKNDS